MQHVWDLNDAPKLNWKHYYVNATTKSDETVNTSFANWSPLRAFKGGRLPAVHWRNALLSIISVLTTNPLTSICFGISQQLTFEAKQTIFLHCLRNLTGVTADNFLKIMNQNSKLDHFQREWTLHSPHCLYTSVLTLVELAHAHNRPSISKCLHALVGMSQRQNWVSFLKVSTVAP